MKEEIAHYEEPPATELHIVEHDPLMTQSILEMEDTETKVPELPEPIVQTSSPANIEDVKVEEAPIPISEPSAAPEPIEPTITIPATSSVQETKASRPLPELPNAVIVEEDNVVASVTPNFPPPEIVETASEPAKQHDTPKVQPLEEDKVVAFATPNFPSPEIVETASEPAKQHDTPKVQPLEENKVVASAPPNFLPPEIVESASELAKRHDTPKAQPLELPPPSIVIHDDQISTYDLNSGQINGSNKHSEKPNLQSPSELPPPSIVVHDDDQISTDGQNSEKANGLNKHSETPNVQPLSELPPPSIVVHDDQISTYDQNSEQANGPNKRSEISLRKAALTLDPEPLNNSSLMSPPAVSGSMSAMSLTDVFKSYFTGGTNGEQSFRSSTPPPLPGASPLSPMATLAYDAPETPPMPATVTPPDPRSFLSPPASGFPSALPSSGNSSMGSISSLGSRPMSMIELSPSRVARATKMTPATSRGVPVFLPPNTAGARKSDFVFFPPTPDAEETDFGSAVLHKASRSMTDLSEMAAKESNTFTAVVHGKVKETTQKPRPLPETPRKVKRATILETPLSPGQGELAALLQGALWLEDSLDRGELPSEAPVETVEEEKLKEEVRRVAAKAEAEAAAKAQEEERKKIAIAKAQLQVKRDEPTSGRLKHTFLIPLTKARSMHHRKEVSSSKAESFATKPREDLALHPKSAGLPDRSDAGYAKAESAAGFATQQSQPRATTPDNKNTAKLTETPPKSPKISRFASFRRMGSISRPSTVYGHSTRQSESVSSEDSVPVVTPPENNLEFGKKSSSPVNEFGQIPESGSTTSFPSVSPKKSVHSLGRATSFAERIWSRARTRSSSSNLSATSENAPGMHLFVEFPDAVKN